MFPDGPCHRAPSAQVAGTIRYKSDENDSILNLVTRSASAGRSVRAEKPPRRRIPRERPELSHHADSVLTIREEVPPAGRPTAQSTRSSVADCAIGPPQVRAGAVPEPSSSRVRQTALHPGDTDREHLELMISRGRIWPSGTPEGGDHLSHGSLRRRGRRRAGGGEGGRRRAGDGRRGLGGGRAAGVGAGRGGVEGVGRGGATVRSEEKGRAAVPLAARAGGPRHAQTWGITSAASCSRWPRSSRSSTCR